MLKSAQVFAGTVRRRDQEEEKIDFFTVEAAEVNPLGADGDSSDQNETPE